MSQKEEMLKQLMGVEYLAKTSKLGRLLHHPYRYISSLFFKNFTYLRTKKEKEVKTKIFTGREMNIFLPSSTDIYLTGGKSHSSEIRLAKLLIQRLNEGSQFLDIGAHYGYFSLIAREIIGETGYIYSLEPGTQSASLLTKNCIPYENVTIIRKAISDEIGEIDFYEFPNLYSEYNSINADQFKNEKWFADFNPIKRTVEATTIDELTKGTNFLPTLVKIDVEGAEFKVMQGGHTFLKNNNPIIVMEYLSQERGNSEHQKAISLLRNLGYATFTIDHHGSLQAIGNIEDYLFQNHLESDNIVLKK